MKYSFVTVITLLLALMVQGQSDYIVLKKKNNRTLRTYFPGAFLSATTYTGATLNGLILEIRNDSIFVEQQDVRQIGTRFGTPALDTVFYTIALHHKEIYKFNYDGPTGIGGAPRARGISVNIIPTIMMAGGIGYVLLEAINSVYRKESLSANNKLTSMGIAAGVAAAGFTWQTLARRSDRAGRKYNVIYVDMTTPRPPVTQ